MKIFQILFIQYGLMSFSLAEACLWARRPQAQLESEQQYFVCKARFNAKLQSFLDDFESWDRAQKRLVKIDEGGARVLADLEPERQRRYRGDLAFYLDCHTKLSKDRSNLRLCFKYLKNHPRPVLEDMMLTGVDSLSSVCQVKD